MPHADMFAAQRARLLAFCPELRVAMRVLRRVLRVLNTVLAQ